MKRKYGLFIIIVIFLLSGITFSLINRFYTFNYLYNHLIKREFTVNPRVPVSPEKKYLVRIWYYPFYRGINQEDEKDFFRELSRNVREQYTNIQLSIRELSFLEGSELLRESLQEGNPPDIYLNLTNDQLIAPQLQIPVESFLSREELQVFAMLENTKKGLSEHIWGWPFLINQQKWLANGGILTTGGNFLENISLLDKESLLLNFSDETLFRQVLTLHGLSELNLVNNSLNESSKEIFKDTFTWFHKLREQQLFALSSTTMDDQFIKAFLVKNKLVIGPVNSFLEHFLFMKKGQQIKRIFLDDLVEVYSLAIFRQKKYQGDDHSKAVMEVAGIMAEKQSTPLAEKLRLQPAYQLVNLLKNNEKYPQYKRILEITPDKKEFWQEKVLPVWIDFWEKGLTPEEAMSRIN